MSKILIAYGTSEGQTARIADYLAQVIRAKGHDVFPMNIERGAPAPAGYDAPLLALPAHQSPLDLVFYEGKQFPAKYRGGAFIVYHGGAGAPAEQGHRGYDVVFLPFDRAGKPGQPQSFIEGFAGPAPGDRNPAKAAYRPTGAAVAPDGSLYVVDGEKGRLWHIVYDGRN